MVNHYSPQALTGQFSEGKYRYIFCIIHIIEIFTYIVVHKNNIKFYPVYLRMRTVAMPKMSQTPIQIALEIIP